MCILYIIKNVTKSLVGVFNKAEKNRKKVLTTATVYVNINKSPDGLEES